MKYDIKEKTLGEVVEFFTPSDLSAYVDGELENESKEALEHYLSEDPEAASTVRLYQQQMQHLKKLYGDVKTLH